MRNVKSVVVSLSMFMLLSAPDTFAGTGDISIAGTTTTNHLTVGDLGTPTAATPVCHDASGNISTCTAQRPYKVARVALGGGDYTSPVDAVADLANWCGTPSFANPCLIQVYPGIYDIGTSVLTLEHHYLDLAGSGQNNTIIRGQKLSAIPPYQGVVTISATVHVHDIQIVNNREDSNAYGVTIISDNARPVLSRVTLISDVGINGVNSNALLAGSDTDTNYPTVNDSYLYTKGQASTVAVYGNSRLTINNSTIENKCSGACTAINLHKANIVANNLSATSRGHTILLWEDTNAIDYTATFKNSQLTADSAHSIFSGGGTNDFSISIAGTQLNGTLGFLGAGGSGGFTCVYTYDENYAALGVDCL